MLRNPTLPPLNLKYLLLPPVVDEFTLWSYLIYCDWKLSPSAAYLVTCTEQLSRSQLVCNTALAHLAPTGHLAREAQDCMGCGEWIPCDNWEGVYPGQGWSELAGQRGGSLLSCCLCSVERWCYFPGLSGCYLWINIQFTWLFFKEEKSIAPAFYGAQYWLMAP